MGKNDQETEREREREREREKRYKRYVSSRSETDSFLFD